MNYIKENIKEFSVCNIQLWHNLGYTGKGIKVGNTEKAYIESPLFRGKVHDVYGNYRYSKSENDHGNQTAHVIHQVAPDADIYCLNMGLNQSGSKFSGVLIDDTIPMIDSLGISIISSSAYSGGLSINKEKTKLLSSLLDKLVLVSSAGNASASGLSGYAKLEEWLSIGAVGFNDLNDEIFYKSYSSRGKELDFTTFSGLFVPHFGKYMGQNWQLEGTSFSAPMFAGMCGLVQQFFLEKAGKVLGNSEMRLFVSDHIVDLGDLGWDEYYGHGLFVLPDPRDINVGKYTNSIITEPEKPITPEPPKEEDKVIFLDTKDHWAKNYIDFVSEKGLMQGVGDNKFEPNKPMTRAEVATVIARMSGFVDTKK